MSPVKISVDEEFAYRQYPQRRGSELYRVRVLDKAKASGKWKVEFLNGPNEGLVDYARSVNLICLWP